MNFFQDYLSFKEDNSELIEFLIQNNSNIISRFTHVLAVTDYLADQHTSSIVTLDEDENTIFQMGYEYVFNRFNLIDLILRKIFNNNYIEMEQYSKTINLLLYVNDFKDEILNTDEGNTSFNQFETDIITLLEKKEHAIDAHFIMLDELSLKIFDEHNIEYYGVNEIFYDIALEYCLVDEQDVEVDLGL